MIRGGKGRKREDRFAVKTPRKKTKRTRNRRNNGEGEKRQRTM